MTEAEAQAFVTKDTAVWAGGIGDDFQTVWHENGTPRHAMPDRPLKGRDIHHLRKAAAPLRAARREAPEPTMCVPVAGDGTSDRP